MKKGYKIIDKLERAELLDFTSLTRRETDIFCKKVVDCKTFDEIGEEYNVTGERVRQILEDATEKIKHKNK